MGSNRKSYVILNSLIQALVMLLLAFHFSPKGGMNSVYVTVLLIVNSMNSAFCNVVVNALMVA
jgi:MFS-type transporter involved in bile tolerance (Atg22 family)